MKSKFRIEMFPTGALITQKSADGLFETEVLGAPTFQFVCADSKLARPED